MGLQSYRRRRSCLCTAWISEEEWDGRSPEGREVAGIFLCRDSVILINL